MPACRFPHLAASTTTTPAAHPQLGVPPPPPPPPYSFLHPIPPCPVRRPPGRTHPSIHRFIDSFRVFPSMTSSSKGCISFLPSV